MTEYIPLIWTVIGCIIGVVGFFLGQKKGLSTNAYEQGQKDANIANELKNINQKLDNVIKDTVNREEFSEFKQKEAVLEQRVVELEKNVFRKDDE